MSVISLKILLLLLKVGYVLLILEDPFPSLICLCYILVKLFFQRFKLLVVGVVSLALEKRGAHKSL